MRRDDQNEASTEELAKTGVAVRLAEALLEGASAELTQTVGTHEVLRMVPVAERIDASTARDGLLASCTHHAQVATVVLLAIKITILCVEATTCQFQPTILAFETVLMPRLF